MGPVQILCDARLTNYVQARLLVLTKFKVEWDGPRRNWQLYGWYIEAELAWLKLVQDGKVTAHSRTAWGHGHLRCRIIVAKMAIEALNERLDRVKKPVILWLLKIAVVVTIQARLSLYRAKLLRLV